jgi:predicted adenylyl cyclase CyaB
MIETEVKIKIKEEELERITHVLGKPKLKFVEQKNIIYRIPGGFLRIRYEEGRKIITFKGKRQEGRMFNSREEIEFDADSEEIKEIAGLLERLGFTEPLIYNKKRANVDFLGCVVSIDLLNEDIFLEIEGREEKNILKILKLFDMEKKVRERRSYLEILEDGMH